MGHKQTFAVQKGMSALPPIATLIASFGISALGQKRTFTNGIPLAAPVLFGYPVRYSHQFGETSRTHLVEHSGAVDLDGFLVDAKIAAYLLV